MFNTLQSQNSALPGTRSFSRRQFIRAGAAVGLAIPFPRNGLANSTSARGETRIVAGLEVGTSKVCVAVGKQHSDGTIEICGIGQTPARILKDGVLDFDLVNVCVREALIDAEAKTDVMIRSVVLALGGTYTSCRVYDAGAQLSLDDHCCRFDARNGILEGFGPDGLATDGCFLLLHALRPFIERRVRSVQNAGVECEKAILAGAASAAAVLDSNQKSSGALVIDLGAKRTTSVAYVRGTLRSSSMFPFGCQNWANPPAFEEFLSDRLRGVCDAAPYFSELPLDSFGSGIHLTGGCSTQPGIEERAREYFARMGLPLQLAVVKGVVGNPLILENPRYACAIGLVKSACNVLPWPAPS